VKPKVNERSASARQACRNCWGPVSLACQNSDTHCREVAVHRNRSSRGRSHMAGSVPAEDYKPAADSNRPAGADNRMAAREIRRPHPATNPIRPNPIRPNHLHATPSRLPTRRRASHRHPNHPHASHRHPNHPHASHHHHRAIEPGQWRGTTPGPERQQLIGRQRACVKRSWRALPASSVALLPYPITEQVRRSRRALL
jgi:hypothetical protein